MAEECDLLQICPYDKPPFYDICRTHSAAARELGWTARTVFLHSPDRRAQFSPVEADRYYMDGPEDPAGLHHLRQIKVRKVCLFHRYRSLRVARRAGFKADKEVLLAHEFGLMTSKWRWLRLKLSERKLLLAGVSPAVAAELQTPWVIPNGLDAVEEEKHRVSRAVAREHLGVSGADLVVGVIGRLHRKKNTLLALEGFNEFAKNYDGQAQLLFIGDGPLRPRLEQRAADLGAPVKFSGFVDGANRYVQALDLLLFPAADVEAFGMVALEAMLANVPVVASRAPGPGWVLGEGIAYFESNEPAAVAQALNKAAVERVSNSARAHEHFSPQAIAQVLQEVANS